MTKDFVPDYKTRDARLALIRSRRGTPEREARITSINEARQPRPTPAKPRVPRELSPRQLFGQSRCDICGEWFLPTDEVGEFAPLPRKRKHTIAHADCGLNANLELA